MDKWYFKAGIESDIVFSVRVRLARNLADFPFPNKMSDEQKFDVIQKVSDAILKSEKGKDYKFVDMDKLTQVEAFSLVERHLISVNFAKNTKGRALILKEDESVSIMINEEDHIRIQCLHSGLEFEEASKEAFELEKLLGKTLNYAFDEKFGYLTECPTNLGTGMRASAMLHLPALENIGALDRLFDSVAKLGIAVRGTFGEGSKSKNSMYQISNQVTLGVSESDSVENIRLVIKQLVSKEKEARTGLENINVENRVCRSLAILKYARLLSSEELYRLLSDVRLGISLNMINLPIEKVNKLNLLYGKAGIMSFIENDSADELERDKKRAQMIRMSLDGSY